MMHAALEQGGRGRMLLGEGRGAVLACPGRLGRPAGSSRRKARQQQQHVTMVGCSRGCRVALLSMAHDEIGGVILV
jgi:hypothetical protein